MSTLSLQKTEAESWKLENPQNNPAVTDLEQKIRELNEELLSKFFVLGSYVQMGHR